MKWSVSNVLGFLFMIYMANSVYNIISVYFPPTCNPVREDCYLSYLASKPKLQLIVAVTEKPRINSWRQLTIVDTIKPFHYNKDFDRNLTIKIFPSTKKNGTMFMYTFLAPIPKNDREGWQSAVERPQTFLAFSSLSDYLIPEAETFKLLNNDEHDTKKKAPVNKKRKDKPVVHLTKRLKLVLPGEHAPLPKKELPDDIFGIIRAKDSMYFPPFRFDKLDSRVKDFYPINDTQNELQFLLQFRTVPFGSIRVKAQFEMATQSLKQFGFSDKDIDEVKGIFTDTNVYILALTMFIASVHLLFDFLSFKNDIIYWKKRKTTSGLSNRTIFWRCFSQLVIFLYLLEEKSSLLVIIPAGVGSLIEIWKVSKALKIRVIWRGFKPSFEVGTMTAAEKDTDKYDTESMKYLSYILYPLCIGGAIYSLLYTPHKSWYSWTIQSLVNGVYAFGFLFMLPQLFINYRLKSVAHLPWRAFMYKAFNTFIDDLFAFIITMPTSHRVACFRDDVVFLVYLYQRWLYPVDKKRIDHGHGGELEVEDSHNDQLVEKKQS